MEYNSKAPQANTKMTIKLNKHLEKQLKLKFYIITYKYIKGCWFRQH